MRRFGRLWGFLLFLVGVVVLFHRIVLPFIMASLVVYLLAPLVRRMAPRIGRGGAIVVCYLGILGALIGFVGYLLPALLQDVARMRDALPAFMEQINAEWLPRASEWVDSTFGALMPHEVAPEAPAASEIVITTTPNGDQILHLDNVRLRVSEASGGGWLIEPPGKDDSGGIDEVLRNWVADSGKELTLVIGEAAGAVVAGIASFLTQFVLTFMLAAFLLLDLSRVLKFVLWLVPPEYRDDVDEIARGMDRGMSGVIRGQLIICLVNGFLTYLGMLLIGVKYSLLLGLLAAVFSLVPIFGTIISSIPIIVVALVSNDAGGLALGKAVAILAWICGIHLIEANFLNPKIIGTAAQIHPVIVVFALLAGESVAGLTGALLAVPVASMIQTVFLFARRHATAFPRDDRDTLRRDDPGESETRTSR